MRGPLQPLRTSQSANESKVYNVKWEKARRLDISERLLANAGSFTEHKRPRRPAVQWRPHREKWARTHRQAAVSLSRMPPSGHARVRWATDLVGKRSRSEPTVHRTPLPPRDLPDHWGQPLLVSACTPAVLTGFVAVRTFRFPLDLLLLPYLNRFTAAPISAPEFQHGSAEILPRLPLITDSGGYGALDARVQVAEGVNRSSAGG